MSEKVFINNELVDIDKAVISIKDAGFLYGAGLFETMRSYNGTVFALDDHLDRLFASIEALSINNTYSREDISDAIDSVLAINNLTNARIRLTITSGSIAIETDHPQTTLLVTASNLTPYPKQYYEKGIMVILSPYRQNPYDSTSSHKTTSYFSRILTLNLAHQKRGTEAIWFTTNGFLAEGCISNVFLVKDSAIQTPTLETPVLPGITRKIICQLAHDNSIELIEKDITIDDTLSADEVFITNSIMEVMPVNSLEKHLYNNGKVGEVTKKIAALYKQLVENQCGAEK